MPITSRQFELGIDNHVLNCMRQVQSFLYLHSAKAFEKHELESGLAENKALFRDVFPDVLEFMVEIGAIDRKDVKGITYYAYYADFQTLLNL